MKPSAALVENGAADRYCYCPGAPFFPLPGVLLGAGGVLFLLALLLTLTAFYAALEAF